MSEWVTAEKFCISIFDGTHDTPKPVEQGKKLITSKNLFREKIDFESAYDISLEDFENINKRSQVRQYDILFSMIGTVGTLYFEQSEDIEYAIKNIGVFSCQNKERAEWLYYYLQSDFAQKYIKSYLNGAVQKFLPLKALREFPVPEFDSIVYKNFKILSDLDAKISLNNQINEQLEEMAKTLYDYWFVQFDFPDKNGKPYKSSGGKMVYNDQLKREIPEGWGVESVTELAELKNGINYEKVSSGDSKAKIINVRNISSSTLFANGEELDEIILDEAKFTNYLVDEDTILITRSGIPGATRLVMNVQPNTIYSGFIIGAKLKNKNMKNLLFFALKNMELSIKSQSAGTIMKNISQASLSEIKLAVPISENINDFNARIKPILNQIVLLNKQNQELTQLRDWLLPMLMNGQVRVE